MKELKNNRVLKFLGRYAVITLASVVYAEDEVKEIEKYFKL